MPDLSLKRFVTRAARIKAEHRTRLVQHEVFADLYHKRHWMSLPDDENAYQVTLPVHTIVVNTAHAILTGMEPTIKVYPNRPTSQSDQARADDVEQWHRGADRMNTEAAGDDQWELAVFDQCQDGIGVIREVYDFPPGWTNGKADEGSLLRHPVVQQALNPRQVFWEWGNPPRGRFRCVFYEMSMTVEEIEARFGVDVRPQVDQKQKPLLKDFEEKRLVVDWWEWIGSDIWHCIFTHAAAGSGPGLTMSPVGVTTGAVTGSGVGTSYGSGSSSSEGDMAAQFLKEPVKMPEYFVLPYFIFPFYRTTSRKYHEWGLSVLYPLTDLVHNIELLSSMKMRMVEMYADPTIIAERNPQNSSQPIPIEKGPGVIVDTMTGDKVYYLQWQGAPPDDRYLIEMFNEVWHELSFSKTLMAQGSADATGFRTALDRETSLLKISKGMQNYEAARAELYQARAYAMSKLSPDRPIPARGIDPDSGKRFSLAIRGDRLGQYRDISVEVKPRFPGDLQRELSVAQQAVALGVWDIEDAQEYVQTPNKAKTRQGHLDDLVEFHPMRIQAMVEDLVASERAATAPTAPVQPALPAAGSMTNSLLAGRPGPPPGSPGPPGAPGSPGQPAGAAAASPMSAGVDNRMAAFGGTPGGGPAQGTVTPQTLTDLLLRQSAAQGPATP